METMTQVRSRTGWREEETERLFRAVADAAAQGSPLRSVFDTLSGELGRKPNSIRNYYYARVRQRPEAAPLRAAPFQTFTEEEVRALVRQVLMARGEGESVRACVLRMAEGDHSRMLRFQNKYRTVLRRDPGLIDSVCRQLRAEGLPCPDNAVPAAQAELFPADNPEMSALLAEKCVADMLTGLKELLHRAARPTQAPQLQRQLDRMLVQHDLHRAAWERDYDRLNEKHRQLTAVLRDFLSLPRESQVVQLDALRDAVAASVEEEE